MAIDPTRTSTSGAGTPGFRPHPIVQAVVGRLLALAGDSVSMIPPDDPFVAFVALTGHEVPAAGARLWRGEDHRCHQNAARLWAAAPETYLIQTGFALSGGVWYTHSWFLDRRGRVVETTCRFERYYGAVLSDQEAALFANVCIPR